MHPLTTEDCAYDDTGEKWEEFEDYIYAVISVPVNFYAALEYDKLFH
jgi:Mg2+ and Co2+ transporter CorA